jgi:hypothetical protein
MQHTYRVFATSIAFVLLIGLQQWRVVSAYLTSVLIFWSHAEGDSPHWPVFAWFGYSFAFWAVGHHEPDNVLLLTVTTLAQAAAILLSDALPEVLLEFRGIVALVAGVVLCIPFHCNNMHYAPVAAIFRLGIYFALSVLDGKRHWLARQYPLFATQEVVVLLFGWHAFVWVRAAKRREEEKAPVLPVANTVDVRLRDEIAAALNEDALLR